MMNGRMPWQGTARNGLPERIAGGYVHPGWVGGRPSAADNPPPGCCGKCGSNPSSRVHKARCLGQRLAEVLPNGELCGTVEGYRVHQRNGDPADDACLAAWALRGRLERAAGDPAKCQRCGYKLGSSRCVVACGAHGGQPLETDR